MKPFADSPAMWNRTHADLRSDEILAQILDRGSMNDWRELYALAKADAGLRRRIARLLRLVPLPLGYFWLAALQSLGEPADYAEPLPNDPLGT